MKMQKTIIGSEIIVYTLLILHEYYTYFALKNMLLILYAIVEKRQKSEGQKISENVCDSNCELPKNIYGKM